MNPTGLFLGTFQDRETERAYRRWHFAADRGHALQLIVVGALFMGLFIPVDFSRFAEGAVAVERSIIRAAVVLCSLVAFVAVWRSERPSPLDRAMVAWAVAVVGAMLVLNALNPHHAFAPLTLDVVVIVGCYTSITNLRGARISLALALSAGDLAILALGRPAFEEVPFVSAAIVFLSANAIGIVAALALERSQRTQYLALAAEHEARLALEAAAREVRTLRGMVPTCGGCRRVRSADGGWQHLERYVAAATGAQFSHGVCPDCSRRLYPGVLGS